MQIKEMKTSELIPYENNPRKNEAAVEKVAASIREFGFKVPIVVDRNNVIAAGHTRLEAAKILGMETVPVIMADDLTDEQIRAFRLADNKTGELAEWDFEKLKEELESVKEIRMEDFGFMVEAIQTFKEKTQEEAKEKEIVKIFCPRCGKLVAVE